MIDLSKSCLDHISKPPNVKNNIRFHLAKAKMDEYFIKFLSLTSTQDLIQNLINDIQGPHQLITQQPQPYILNKQLSLSVIQSANKSPKKESDKKEDHIDKYKLGQDLTHSLIIEPAKFYEDLSINKPVVLPSKPPQYQETIQEISIPKLEEKHSFAAGEEDKIPANIFKPKLNNIESEVESIEIIFSIELDLDGFEKIVTQVLGLPKFFTQLVFEKIDKNQKAKIKKSQFLSLYNQHLKDKDPVQRSFTILSNFKQSLTFDDLRPLMKVLLNTHPGLEFLQQTPEFQDRYSDTVIYRIFYKLNRRDDGKITFRDFKNSDFYNILQVVDKEEDINKIRQYFSYEHFYVVYCKFWELDTDHDFHITKEDFSRYSGHGLSKKTVDRIFDCQAGRKFTSKMPEKMAYQDFVWFILSEEDKTTLTSLDYWFRVIDLDCNGIITGSEIEYFFEEQKQRLDYLNHDPVIFQDIVCQMCDLLKPEKELIFTLDQFKRQQSQSGVFFSFLTNLNKLVAYEQRDPFAVRNDLQEHPDFTDWDRYAYTEYIRLAMEEDNQEQGEAFEEEILEQ